MRLAVLSDIHGNLAALEAVLEDARRQAIDGVIAAGDYTACPDADEVVRRLRGTGAYMIRGNGEEGVLSLHDGSAPAAWYSSKQYALARWVLRHLNADTLSFFSTLPEQDVLRLPGASPIRVVHGSPRYIGDFLFPDRDAARMEVFRQAGHLDGSRTAPPLRETLSEIPEAVLVCGHTHIAWQQAENCKMAMNPGAVCGPLEGDPAARYALLTWSGSRWEAELRTVPYDLHELQRSFTDSGLLEEGGALARCFLLSNLTGRNVAHFFLTFARGLAAGSYADCDVLPDDIWDQAVATFDWDRYEEQAE